MNIDDVAAKLQRRVYDLTLAKPARRHQIVGAQVYGRPGGVRWAVRDATATVDGPAPRRTFADRLLRRPAPDRPHTPSIDEHEAAAFQRRLQSLRARGIELSRDDNGRWLRREGKNLVPVETQRQLVQARVRAGERAARKVALNEAGRLGVPTQDAVSDPTRTDPRVYDVWVRQVAMHTSRIAHDAVMDVWRDAAFDRLELLGEGWVRECEPNACGACLALADGVVHPASDRTFLRHTRCRCRPRRASLRRPATGQEVIDRLDDEQLATLFAGRGGAVKARALRRGQIRLSDLLLVDASRAARTDYVIGETPVRALPIDATQ